MSFARNFAMGQQIAQTAMDAFDQARLGKIMSETKDAKVKELAEVEDAVVKPVNQDAPGQPQATDATPVKDVAQPVIASAEHPFANPDVPTLPADPVAAAPKVPDAVAEQPQRVQVSPKQYQFLGKTYDQPLTDDQMKAARTDSLKGRISELFNPVRGLKQMRELELQDQEDWKFGLMKTEAAHKAEERKKQENIKQAGVKALSESYFGQANTAYAQDLSAWQEENAKRQAQIGAGTPEADLPAMRAKPVMPVISPAQMIASNLAIMNAQVAAGADFDPKTFASHAEAYQKLQEEGLGRALTAAAEGAPIERVAELFNKSGKARFDPTNVVADVTRTDANGAKSRVITYFDPEQKRNITIDTGAELAALGKAGEQLKMAYERGRLGVQQAQIDFYNSGTKARNSQAELASARVGLVGAQQEVQEKRADGTLPGGTGQVKGKTTADRAGMTQAEIAKEDLKALYDKAGSTDTNKTIGGAARIGAAIDQLAALNPSAKSSELLDMATQMQRPEFAQESAKRATVALDPITGSIVRAIPSPADGSKTMSIGRLSFDQLDKAGREQLSSAVRNQAGELGIGFQQLRAAARDQGQAQQLLAMVRDQAKFKIMEAAKARAAETGVEIPQAQIEKNLKVGMQRIESLLGIARQLYANQ